MASEASAWERQGGGGARGQGLSPSLHCPLSLSCPCWDSRSPPRTSESRPRPAHGDAPSAEGRAMGESGERREGEGGEGGICNPPMECGER